MSKVSVAEGASKASSPEQANKGVVQANELMDERVAQYLRLDSCLFQTTVSWCNCPTPPPIQYWVMTMGGFNPFNGVYKRGGAKYSKYRNGALVRISFLPVECFQEKAS